MALLGRLHPLLIHFPIALVIAAALAEGAATIAGWRLALAPEMEASPLLEWHRWLGTGHIGGLLVWGANFLRP